MARSPALPKIAACQPRAGLRSVSALQLAPAEPGDLVGIVAGPTEDHCPGCANWDQAQPKALRRIVPHVCSAHARLGVCKLARLCTPVRKDVVACCHALAFVHECIGPHRWIYSQALCDLMRLARTTMREW